MALKEEPYALPLKLGGRGFTKATVCGANSCILGSYYDTPSIAWMSISPLVVDGEIVVLPKYVGWSQKCPLRAEWPYAVALFKRPGVAKNLSLFIYHLAEASYKIHKVPTDAQVALMMGYERVAIVFKDEIQVLDLHDPTRRPLYIPAQISVPLIPSLCHGTVDTLVLTSTNIIQEWTINTKTGKAKMSFQCRAEGFGFVEVVAYWNTIAAVSEGGVKIHFYDTQEAEHADQEVTVASSVPVTKMYIDEEYIVLGLADGTMKLYDRESRLFLGQLNIIPVAARGATPGHSDSPSSSHSTGAHEPFLQHKISFLARQEDFLIAAMLDPSQNVEARDKQLEVSIWPIRGQNLVQPLKTKLLPGTVNFMHYEERNTRLIALTQYERPSQAALSAANSAYIGGGPLIAITWRPPFKSLLMNGIKWRETNDQLQAKLAQEVMEKVLLEPSFFRAMFMVDTDPEEIEQVVDSMFISLASRESLFAQFVDTAIAQEIVLRRQNPSPNSSAVSIHHSSPNLPGDAPQGQDSKKMSSSAGSIKDTPIKVASDTTQPQYFPEHAMTTAVLTRCLVDHSYNYMSVVLSKPLTHMMKSEVAAMSFSLPSTAATPEDQPMFHSLIKVTSGIMDGLIDNQSKISPALQRLLSSVHQAVCADNSSDSELKCFRRGAARVFLDYVILPYWLEPAEHHLVNKIPDEVRHNLRVVAQLLQVIAGYTKHKLTDPALCSLVTEYSTKWRSWLLSRVSDSESASKKSKDGKKPKTNVPRAANMVGTRGGNPKTAGLVVTKFIITHSLELLSYMTRGGNRSPDPCATRIRAISESLLMPIMSMMAKKGTKDSQLAASLRVFGKNGSNSTGRDSSTDSTESSEHSHSSEHEGRSTTPSRQRRKGSSAASSGDKTVDSHSGSEGLARPLAASTDAATATAAGDQRKSRSGSRKTKHTTSNPDLGRKRSSGSLTSSTVEDFEDDAGHTSRGSPERRRIEVVGEIEEEIHDLGTGTESREGSLSQLGTSAPTSPATAPKKRKKASKSTSTKDKDKEKSIHKSGRDSPKPDRRSPEPEPITQLSESAAAGIAALHLEATTSSSSAGH